MITFSLGEGLATTSPDSPAYSRAWSSEGVDVFDTGYSTPGQVAAWRERFEGPNYRGYPHYLPPALAAVGRFVSEPSLIVRVDGGRSPAPNGVRIAVRQAIDLEADDLRLTSLVPPQVYPQAAILYYAAAQDLSLDFRQPPAAATLIVDSTPRGADVFLDGAATGQTTPATIPGVTLGNHVLRLAKAGYAEWVETIAVQHDPETVSRTLAALPGGLTLRSAPEGARITLDGRDSGRFTPATFTGLAAGAHTYRLTKPGYLPVPGAVSVPPGLTVAVDVNLNLRRYSWGFSVASTLDTAADVLVNLPGLGRLQDTGNPQAGRGLDLYADGNAGLEYSILRPDFDAEGTAGSGGVSVELPHYRSFQVQLSQPDQGTSAWSFLRENDGVVVGLFAATGAGATGNAATKPAVVTSRVARLSGSARDTLLEIPGLGGVRDTGNPSKPRKLEIYSDGPQVVEWSLRYEATYRQGEVRPGKAVEIDFPHYTAFELQIARPFARQSGILFAKENDNRLVGVAAASGGSGPAAYAGSLDLDLTDGLRQTLIEFPGLGGVREAAGPAGTTMLELYSSGEVVELTLQSGKTQLRKEVAAGAAPVLIPFPHGQPFKLSIARPFRADTLGWGWLFLKESGGHLVGHVLVSR